METKQPTILRVAQEETAVHAAGQQGRAEIAHGRNQRRARSADGSGRGEDQGARRSSDDHVGAYRRIGHRAGVQGQGVSARQSQAVVESQWAAPQREVKGPCA